MALEASDMSDGAILEGTKQYQNGNGQVQFKITLPSGRELESEWLQPDMKKKAMVAWLDVVKAEALNDADSVRAEAREAAMKQRRDAGQAQAQTQAPGSTEALNTASYSVPTAGTASAVVSAPHIPVTSPDSFVAAGLSAAQADYDHWNNVAQEATQRLIGARKNIDKWTNLKIALEGNETQDSISRSGTGNRSASTRPKRRKRLPKSTDFQDPVGGDQSVRGA